MSPRAIPVSAPGKLFLLGEYAVLGGGPALVTSVNRHVHVEPRNDRGGYELRGADFSNALRLPYLVQTVLKEQENLDIDINQLTVDVGEFVHEQTKLGIGSSAASTVAIVASTAPHLPMERRFELAWEIHRRLQGGSGSGADIAASTFGGTVAFHLHDRTPPFDELDLRGLLEATNPLVTDVATVEGDLELPEQLRIDAVWTGSSALSVSFVTAVAKALRHHPRTTSAILKSIAARARVGIKALRDGDADRFVDAIRKGDRAMERLGNIAQLPIVTDTHRRIRALAHATHCVAKPSGAGGGDFTLLVSPADAPVPSPIESDYLVVPVA